MSLTPTAQPTARRRNSTKKTSGSTRREFLPLWSKAGPTPNAHNSCALVPFIRFSVSHFTYLGHTHERNWSAASGDPICKDSFTDIFEMIVLLVWCSFFFFFFFKFHHKLLLKEFIMFYNNSRIIGTLNENCAKEWCITWITLSRFWAQHFLNYFFSCGKRFQDDPYRHTDWWSLPENRINKKKEQ